MNKQREHYFCDHIGDFCVRTNFLDYEGVPIAVPGEGIDPSKILEDKYVISTTELRARKFIWGKFYLLKEVDESIRQGLLDYLLDFYWGAWGNVETFNYWDIEKITGRIDRYLQFEEALPWIREDILPIHGKEKFVSWGEILNRVPDSVVEAKLLAGINLLTQKFKVGDRIQTKCEPLSYESYRGHPLGWLIQDFGTWEKEILLSEDGIKSSEVSFQIEES